MNMHFLQDTYNQLILQDNLDGLFGVMTKSAENLGLPMAVYGNFSQDSLTGETNPVMAINYPAHWANEYFEDDLIHEDPVTRYLMSAGQAVTWDKLARSKADRAFFDRAAGAGLAHGVSVPLIGPSGGKFALSFASCDPVSQEQAHKAKMLAEMCHAIFLERLWPTMHDNVQLTGVQKQILEQLALGHTMQEVADAMGITLDGVRYHLRQIANKLGTRNVTHSVAVAIQSKLIW
jgi:DNA-binding CsgD family transcriptional regulator